MNESTYGVRSGQSQRPQDQENHKNSPKHVQLLSGYKPITSNLLPAQCLLPRLLVNLLSLSVSSFQLLCLVRPRSKIDANFIISATI